MTLPFNKPCLQNIANLVDNAQLDEGEKGKLHVITLGHLYYKNYFVAQKWSPQKITY